MDYRWRPFSRDSKRGVRVILHPTASIWEVRRGLDPGSDDSIDLSEFVTQGTQTAFDVNLTLSFNRELFGEAQPEPNQILEIQLWQDEAWKPIWLGIVEAINGFTLQRGTRSMQLIAKSRDSQDIWRLVKRLTPLFPVLTEFTHIIQRIARQAGMKGDEIVLPASAFTTAHSNTQMADMNAWDMIQAVCTPLGWTPFIDGLGRLRMANRQLQGRVPDIVLEDSRLIKVGGQRQRPPKSRVRVMWLNPTMKQYKKQDQLLGSPQTITLGWFIPYWKRTVWFSDDHTQRAVDGSTRINWNTSTSVNEFAKEWLGFDFVEEKWKQQAENRGKLSFRNWQSIAALSAFTAMIFITKTKVDHVQGLLTGNAGLVPGLGGNLTTLPAAQGSIAESIALGTWALMAMTVGTGTYEIWGTPFEWVHARNISEAFNVRIPLWVDNPVDIESDFIVNEEHGKATAIRELIYQSREVNKWSVTLVDDPRIEYGDILKFTDGSQLYVEDFSRSLERGSEATLDVKGFLIPKAKISQRSISSPVAPPSVVPPGMVIPPVNAARWFGALDLDNDGTFPGNCVLFGDPELCIRRLTGEKIAWYVNGEPDGDPDAIEAAVVALKARIAADELEDLPVLAYVPHGVAFPPSADWIGIESYWKKPLGETLSRFEHDRKARAVEANRPVVFIAQTYFSNANNAGHTDQSELVQLVPVYGRLMIDVAACKGTIAFSAGSWRATGYDDPLLHDHIAAAYEELATTITVPA